MNSLSIEEELNGSFLSSAGCSSKISSLVWHEYPLNHDLMHVYELIDDQLVLIGRIYLSDCKHRWLTSLAVIAIFEAADDDSEETTFLATGDKCGNLYV
jgi:hypothetical protein